MTYAQISELYNVSRSKVAADIRDFRKDKPVTKQPLRPSAPNVGLRAVVFDIETMPNNFTAESEIDILVCTSFLPLDQKEPYTIQLTHKEMIGLDNIDYRVLAETMAELDKYDILIGHNIARYDLNWLLTRIIYYGMPTPQTKHLYYDTFSAAQRISLKTWKNLGNLGVFLDVEDGVKTKIQRPEWTKLFTSDKKQFDTTMKEIVFHCENDVVLNRYVFNELWTRDKKMASLPVFKKW